jgi:hypothetical protein
MTPSTATVQVPKHHHFLLPPGFFFFYLLGLLVSLSHLYLYLPYY